MISALRDFLERRLGSDNESDRKEHGVELATAALFAEMMRIDGETSAEERAAAHDAIVDRLGLSPAEAAELLEAAHEEARTATDYFQFTSLLNRHFTQEQKIAVIERMWRVAYADARLDDHELHLIRRIADLLHVPHPDFIAAKVKAQRKVKGEG